MSDINRIAAYDDKVIDCINEHGFSRIYNSFDTGTWLAFYDIPVHIDNRSDPYMEAYSGIDYLTGTMVIDNIDDMDKFVDQYSPDAIVLALDPELDIDFISDLLISDRYRVEYDNTCISNCDASVYYRWMVFKCVYTS